MSKKLQSVLYWLSVVRPIVDILCGTWKGIVQVIQSNREYERRMKEIAQIEKDLAIPSLSEYQDLNKEINNERIKN